MAQWAKDEDEIDVLVFAMRRVFGFDYWLGENNGEFGVSFHYHGQDFVRSPLPAPEEEDWGEQLDAKLDAALRQLAQPVAQQLETVSEMRSAKRKRANRWRRRL